MSWPEAGAAAEPEHETLQQEVQVQVQVDQRPGMKADEQTVGLAETSGQDDRRDHLDPSAYTGGDRPSDLTVGSPEGNDIIDQIVFLSVRCSNTID